MGIILETIDVDIMICKRNIGENRARMCLLLIYASYQLLLIIFLNKIQRIRFQGKQKTNEKIGHARVLNRRKLKCWQNFHHLLEIILDSWEQRWSICGYVCDEESPHALIQTEISRIILSLASNRARISWKFFPIVGTVIGELLLGRSGKAGGPRFFSCFVRGKINSAVYSCQNTCSTC